jgi:hypothetical protein
MKQMGGMGDMGGDMGGDDGDSDDEDDAEALPDLEEPN